MKTIRRPEDLDSLRKKAAGSLALREESDRQTDGQCTGLASGTGHIQILICLGDGSFCRSF